jgi:hypothetical protein
MPYFGEWLYDLRIPFLQKYLSNDFSPHVSDSTAEIIHGGIHQYELSRFINSIVRKTLRFVYKHLWTSQEFHFPLKVYLLCSISSYYNLFPNLLPNRAKLSTESLTRCIFKLSSLPLSRAWPSQSPHRWLIGALPSASFALIAV